MLGASTAANPTGNSTIGNFNQNSGSPITTGNVLVTSNANLSGGSQSGNGTTTLQGNTTISSSGLGLDAGRILRNEGTVTWSGGSLNLNDSGNGGSGRIDNAAGALWDNQGNHSIVATAFVDLNNIAGSPAFNNAGTFRKSGGTSTTSIQVAFNNTGKVEVQQGTVSLSGNATNGGFTNNGAISVAANTVFETNASNINFNNFGSLEGNGTVRMAGSNNILTNRGGIDPKIAGINAGGVGTVGALNIDFGNNGTFRQLADGTLNFELASLTSFDTLAIHGTNSHVALTGTLQISSLAGFNPGQNDSFTLMTFNPGKLTGVFDNVVLAGFSPSVHFDVQYLSNSIVINTSAVPLPGSAWLMLSGMGLLAARRKSAAERV